MLNFWPAYFDKRSNDSQAGQSKVLKWSSLRGCVQKRVQEQGNMCLQKHRPRFGVRGDALQQCKCIADLYGANQNFQVLKFMQYYNTID